MQNSLISIADFIHHLCHVLTTDFAVPCACLCTNNSVPYAHNLGPRERRLVMKLEFGCDVDVTVQGSVEVKWQQLSVDFTLRIREG